MYDHLVRFYGLCQDPDNICILVEYCAKGSLTDLLDVESLTLDWPFKFSLLNDIADVGVMVPICWADRLYIGLFGIKKFYQVRCYPWLLPSFSFAFSAGYEFDFRFKSGFQ